MFISGVNDTGDKLFGVNDTAEKLLTGVNEIETIPMTYSGARGTLIYEKNLRSKISCQTPFNSKKQISEMEINNRVQRRRNRYSPPQCFLHVEQ
jgi:hypothetical protein